MFAERCCLFGPHAGRFGSLVFATSEWIVSILGLFNCMPLSWVARTFIIQYLLIFVYRFLWTSQKTVYCHFVLIEENKTHRMIYPFLKEPLYLKLSCFYSKISQRDYCFCSYRTCWMWETITFMVQYVQPIIGCYKQIEQVLRPSILICNAK